jgi:hypothetical protein
MDAQRSMVIRRTGVKPSGSCSAARKVRAGIFASAASSEASAIFSSVLSRHCAAVIVPAAASGRTSTYAGNTSCNWSDGWLAPVSSISERLPASSLSERPSARKEAAAEPVRLTACVVAAGAETRSTVRSSCDKVARSKASLRSGPPATCADTSSGSVRPRMSGSVVRTIRKKSNSSRVRFGMVKSSQPAPRSAL